MAININPNAFSPSATGTRPAERAAATSDARAAASTSSGTIVQDGVSLSATSRQLAQSAIQAEQRDASLTRSQLADEASRLRDQFSGNTYNEAAAVREVPDTDDPALLERAKQATEFTQSHGRRGTNPFANLSDDQLTLVMYDDSGSYTTNERRAAYLEQTDRRQDWKKVSWQRAWRNIKRPARTTNSSRIVLITTKDCRRSNRRSIQSITSNAGNTGSRTISLILGHQRLTLSTANCIVGLIKTVELTTVTIPRKGE